ncbi:MAG: hypothetical protein ACE5JL_07440, partial [Dehalococcoidia bacterium]
MSHLALSHKSLSILLVLTLIFGLAYFLLPSRAQGASLTVTVSPDPQFIGGAVNFTASTTLSSGESISTASLIIDSSNVPATFTQSASTNPLSLPITKSLPLQSGTFDLGDGFTITSVTGTGLTVPATTVPSISGPGTITWEITWKTPVLLDPAPAALVGPLSNPDFAFSVPSPPSPPSPPQSLQKTTPDTDDTPTFTWTDPASAPGGLASFEVRIDGDPGSFQDVGNVNTFTETTPVPLGSHTFFVRAVDSLGQFGQEASLAFNISSPAPAPTPTPTSYFLNSPGSSGAAVKGTLLASPLNQGPPPAFPGTQFEFPVPSAPGV